MGQNLRNSLDLNRRTKDEVGIRVEKLEDVGISFNQLIVSLMLIIVGFMCYYLVPYSIFNSKWTLVFMMLNIVLILIIIGMTFICILIFEYLESSMLWLCINTCCRCDKRLHHVITKNMEAHRPRNSKTSLMFTLAISFLIFAASSFALIATLIVKAAEAIIGSDILANGNNYLDEVPIAEFLASNQVNSTMAANGSSGAVIDWSFTTIRTKKFQELALDDDVDDDELQTSGGSSNSIETKFYGIPENFLDVVDAEFYIPSDMEDLSSVSDLSDGKVNAVGLLFSNDDLSQYPTYPEPDQDFYNIGVQKN